MCDLCFYAKIDFSFSASLYVETFRGIKTGHSKLVSVVSKIILPSARMRSEGTVGLSVCLCLYSTVTSHLSNVCSSQKRYHLPNGH